MAATHANKLFRHDEVARIVGPDEIDVISPVSAAYGLAIILDSNSAVVDYVQKDDAPRKLQPDELALIATDGLLRVSYLSGVPNVSGDKDVGVRIDQLTEEDGISGKERTIRGKVVLEFRIDRYSRKIANHLHDLMRDSDSDRLTKKKFLESFGDDTKDNIANFIQTFIDENGRPKGGPRFRARGRADLSPTLEEYGVEFRNILCNVDRRSNLARAIWPSFQYDHKVVVAAKLVAYTISITSSAIGLLFAADILPIRPSPMVTIGTYANGTVSITGDNCQANEVCDVSRNGSVTVSATPASSDYKLVEWNCIGCTSDLGSDNPVSINGITDDLVITPIFKPFATINIISADTQLGRVSCEIDGTPSTSCRGVSGEVITLKAEVNELGGSQSDRLVNKFDMWTCSIATWCAGFDTNDPEEPLTVPNLSSPEEVTIRADFREDRLIKLRINPVEPSGSGLGRPTVTGCSTSPICDETREGITDVYVFQQNSDSSLPLDLSAPVPDVTSPYKFDSWMCDDQRCPRSLVESPESPESRLLLNQDVTITPTYVEQIVVIINDRIRGGNVEYINSLPSGCTRMSASTICRFSADDFTPLSFDIVAEPDNSDDFRASWECDGPGCPSSSIRGNTFNDEVDMSLTLAPVFTRIQRSRLDWGSSLLGRIAPSLEGCDPDNCMGVDEWSVVATVPEEKDNLQFKEWDCDPQSACTNSTSPETTVNLDNQDVSIRPVFERIPTLTLEGSGVSCDPGSCSTREMGTIKFFVRVPSMMRFTGWECSGDFCSGIDDRSDPDTFIRVGNLSADATVILTPGFELIPTLTLQFTGGGAVSCRPGSCSALEGNSIHFSVNVPPMMRFTGWRCSGSLCGRVDDLSKSSTSIRGDDLSDDTTVTLTPGFEEIPTAYLRVSSTTGGDVDPGCGTNCEREPTWTTTISATARDGYEFYEWDCIRGACPSNTDDPSPSITIGTDTELRAVFREIPMVTLIIDVGEGGYIDSAGSSRSNCSSRCEYEFPVGSSIEVDADPNSGYGFGSWRWRSGSRFSVLGNSSEISITLNDDTRLEVTFIEDAPPPPTRTVACDNSNIRRLDATNVGGRNGLVYQLNRGDCTTLSISATLKASRLLRDTTIYTINETLTRDQEAGDYSFYSLLYAPNPENYCVGRAYLQASGLDFLNAQDRLDLPNQSLWGCDF